LGSKPNFNIKKTKSPVPPIIKKSSYDHDVISIEVTSSPNPRNHLGYDFNKNNLKEVASPSNK